MGKPKKATKLHLPPLTEAERILIRDHAGCTRCRRLNVGHNFDTCEMKETNTWPDPATYKTLMAPTASTATKGEEKDNETDSYVPSPPDIPFTINQLYTTLHATGPLITEFPIPVQALMDIGFPCTVISAELCDRLGLRRYPLPTSENNLSSLSQMPLICEEYVKLELQSGQGAWKSRVHKMKVNKGLPFPIILGMPWLSSEHILIDSHERTAIDKCTGYDVLNPPSPITWANTIPWVPPLPMLKKV